MCILDFQYISACAHLLKQSKAPVPCAERHRRAGWEDRYLISGKVVYSYSFDWLRGVA